MGSGATRLIAALAALALVVGGAWSLRQMDARKDPVRLGILMSRSGPMAASEEPVVEAALLAVEELNEQGGLLGRPVEAVEADGASDPAVFARQAGKLITDAGVSTILGCWTTASRKAVRAVVEARNNLLIYPMQFEGLEQSKSVIYTGAAPNQSLVPAVGYAVGRLGRRVFLVGTASFYTQASMEIAADHAKMLGAEVVGRQMFGAESGEPELQELVRAVAASKADVLISTLSGDVAAALLARLRQRGLGPERLPAMLIGLSEPEAARPAAGPLVGHYSAWSYFQSLPGADNTQFLRRFRARYGAHRVVGDAMQTAYSSVGLWAQAVRLAHSTDPRIIREAILSQSVAAPEGAVQVDPNTQYTWRRARVARLNADRQFEVLWESAGALEPVPYPGSRHKAEWEAWRRAASGESTTAQAWAGEALRAAHR